MARIAESLERIDVIADAAIWHDVVDHAKQAARLEHAMHFAEEFRN